MASSVDLSALILSVARSCDEAMRELKKSNSEVELDQVEMTVTVEADIDDEVLRTPPRAGTNVLPDSRLDLKSKIVAARPAVTTVTGRTTTTAAKVATPAASASTDDNEITGRIELRLLLSRKD